MRARDHRGAATGGVSGRLVGFLLTSVVASLLAPPGIARAGNDLGLTVGPVELLEDVICVSYRATQPLTPRLEETIGQGMPATVTFEVGLWKRRSLWFDGLVLAIRSEHKVVYDPWSQTFRVRSSGSPSSIRALPTLDSLRTALFSSDRLPLTPAAAIDSTSRYYVSVRATIRPLSAEDLGQIEDWLSGESREEAGGSPGVIAYFLGLTANLSGLGDRTALARSESFRPSRLAAPP